MFPSRSRPIEDSRPDRAHRGVSGVVATIRRALFLRRQRRALAHLDAHALRDIGLTRQEAEDEANRPIWDVPTHWRG